MGGYDPNCRGICTPFGLAYFDSGSPTALQPLPRSGFVFQYSISAMFEEVGWVVKPTRLTGYQFLQWRRLLRPVSCRRYGFVKRRKNPLFADSIRNVVPIHV